MQALVRSLTINTTTMNVQYCCHGFQGLIDRAGERGASVIVVRMVQNRLKFRLQSKGIADRDTADFSKIAIPIEVNILLTVTIAYCPYCGRCLEELLDATPAEYEQLAKKHGPFNTVLEA